MMLQFAILETAIGTEQAALLKPVRSAATESSRQERIATETILLDKPAKTKALTREFFPAPLHAASILLDAGEFKK
ncbi:hypothetical protein D6817_05710 [Candidatus Pacearchaeota archaeon]|nr:MAG: hypothetical protein D6817_05710 [Candidatus Pacearchaeota archaeon]